MIHPESIERIPGQESGETRSEIIERDNGRFSLTIEREGDEEIIREFLFTQTHDTEGKALNDPITFDMVDLLPEGYRYATSYKFECYPSQKLVRVPLADLDSPYAVTVVLHEAGHAHRPLPPDMDEDDSDPIGERTAWAHALQTIRDLTKRGIVLDRIWADPGRLKGLVYSSLKSHEEHNACFGDAYTKGKSFDDVDMSSLHRGVDEHFRELEQMVAELAKEIPPSASPSSIEQGIPPIINEEE